MEDLGDFNVLAGLNNAGKSNFLRAMHAFFWDQVEPGISFDFDRDFYRPEIRARRRKTIEISAEFDLPEQFKFRKGLEPVEALLGRKFRITKEWIRDQEEPNVYLNNESAEPLSPEDEDKVGAFLNLINFRYIPNRVIPIDVIRKEHEALRDVLVRRLARYKNQADTIFGAIETTAENLITELSRQLPKIAPDITSIRLSTARSLADLAFRFGYLLRENEEDMEEMEQGSGIQSLLMLQTLQVIDLDYFQQFGWKQAGVWVVEEPESSLHTALEAQVAQFLAVASQGGSGRLQTIATTHSDLMIQYADCGYLIDKERKPVSTSPLGTIARRLSVRELLAEGAKCGISRWVNPILLHPLDPIVIFEGKYDRDFVAEVYRLLRRRPPGEFYCLQDLTGDESLGGIETLKRFIKENRDAIRARKTSAPVIVVLDWDAFGKVGEFKKIMDAAAPYGVIAWDVDDANPVLHKSFRGVERFYATRIVDEGEKEMPGAVSRKADGTICVQSDDYGALKQTLNKIVTGGLEPDDEAFANAFVADLESLVAQLAGD